MVFFRSTIPAGFLSLLLVTATFAGEEIQPLWPGKPPGETKELGPERDRTKPEDGKIAGKRLMRIENVSIPTINIFRPETPDESGTSVIVCPGGAHQILAWDLEGTEVATWLNKIGITAIVLKYRVPFRDPQRKYLSAVQDAQRAVSLVRSQAAGLKINPQRIGILGFSAGGEVAALTAIFKDRLYESVDATDAVSCRPDFAVLVYPAYLADKEQKLREDLTIDGQTPPMFFAHAFDDPVTVESTLLTALALKKAGVAAETHVYATGGHGFGLRPTEEPCSHWPKRCEEWMFRTGLLGKKPTSENN